MSKKNKTPEISWHVSNHRESLSQLIVNSSQSSAQNEKIPLVTVAYGSKKIILSALTGEDEPVLSTYIKRDTDLDKVEGDTTTCYQLVHKLLLEIAQLTGLSLTFFIFTRDSKMIKWCTLHASTIFHFSSETINNVSYFASTKYQPNAVDSSDLVVANKEPDTLR